MNLRDYLDEAFEASLAAAGSDGTPAIVKPAGKPEFGHYQVNGIMGAAKRQKMNPRELADRVLERVSSTPLADQASFEIAGPGFINVTLAADFIADQLSSMVSDERLGVASATEKRILVDYSSPNLAKEMHIGHLRSTAIGDAAVRVLEFLGHEVIRVNHVGDWGAQFGSLLAYMDQLENQGEGLNAELADLEVFYQKASALFKSDEAFAAKAREFVVRLQSGDDYCLTLWQRFIEESITHCQAIYDLLNISLAPENIKAESAYNDMLAEVVADLESQGMLQISEDAKCVFLDEFKGKDGNPIPAIVQKSDGGYPYMATDIAAARYRGQELAVDQALYFVDARQSLHLSQLYAIARQAGYISESQEFRHVPFGTILNKEGKPFKTRDGGAVKLADVANEAVARAQSLISDKNPTLTAEDRASIAHIVGIGAIKYAELSKNRTTDYIFDWDTMLSFEGNTAPYLQYAYTRIQSIFRRSNVDPASLPAIFELTEGSEQQLAIKLLRYPEVIDGVTEDYQANILCNYLFELSQTFSSFYEACPVLKAEPTTRDSRLNLCKLSGSVLQHGLGLLGIETVEQM